MRTSTLLLSLSVFSIVTVASAASEPMACTMEAKLCPDGKTYVGRDSNNGCAFSPCPSETSCKPYMCNDGTQIARCAADGSAINYFAAPCMTHGGEKGDQPFSDVPSHHPNAEAIVYVMAQGIVEGYADGTFKPDAKINRAEFVKIMVDSVYPATECLLKPGQFRDVAKVQWFAPHVCVAAADGWIKGYPDGAFRPANFVNFAEAAKIITIAFGLIQRNEDCNGKLCPDTNTPSYPWYEEYVRALAAKNAIPTSILSFDQKITRGEMAEMIWRMKTGVTTKESQKYELLAGPRASIPESRDAQRRIDVNTILDAVYQYSMEHRGTFPGNIATKATEICQFDTECKGMLNLDALKGKYLVNMPYDPKLLYRDSRSGYMISKGSDGHITVSASRAETVSISVAR